MRTVGWMALGLMLGAAALPVAAQKAAAVAGPVELKVDDLKTPLGIDDPAPRFSWQLKDATRGAKQTAYEVQVASRAELLRTGKADVWTSGRVTSEQSLNVRYGGPALTPSTRYHWRVTVWDAAGKEYAATAASWWETGLLTAGWRAPWIGYETAEEDEVRHAEAAWVANPDADALAAEKKDELHFAFRQTVTLPKAVRRATLYAAAEDTVSAWINGAQVLKAEPLPAWKQMPWKKYVHADLKGKLTAGANVIAIDAVHYEVNPNLWSIRTGRRRRLAAAWRGRRRSMRRRAGRRRVSTTRAGRTRSRTCRRSGCSRSRWGIRGFPTQ